MADKEQLVAVISPWDKVSALVKREFRLESLPTEKKVMVWRDDLQTEEALTGELNRIGIVSVELRKQKTTNWKAVD